MESLAKILELAAKYAWAVFATTAFVLFAPDNITKLIGLAEIKTLYRGRLWLLLIFTGVLVVGAYAGPAAKLGWRFVICPFEKLAFPVRDVRTGIKQSRMRYYRVQFRFRNGREETAFQESNSNGSLIGYFDREGQRYIPEEPHEASVLDAGRFQFRTWGRIDWSDVFNGDKHSGCWGISER